MRKILLSIMLIFLTTSVSNAEDTLALSPQTNLYSQSADIQNIYSLCAKTYSISAENLLYILLSALNQYNFNIEEIQSRTGTVLFKAYSKEFIASISAKDAQNSFLKIIPADNNYNFSSNILQKLHSYVNMNYNTNLKTLL